MLIIAENFFLDAASTPQGASISVVFCLARRVPTHIRIRKQLIQDPPESEFSFLINFNLGFLIQGSGKKQEINAVNQ